MNYGKSIVVRIWRVTTFRTSIKEEENAGIRFVTVLLVLNKEILYYCKKQILRKLKKGFFSMGIILKQLAKF